MSKETLQELTKCLHASSSDRYVSTEQRQNFIRLLGSVVQIRHRVAACRDSKDDKFLHVALNAEAEMIVTDDADLLALHAFHGVDILNPADFLERIR